MDIIQQSILQSCNCDAIHGHGTLHDRGRDYGQTEESRISTKVACSLLVISQGKYGAVKAAEHLLNRALIPLQEIVPGETRILTKFVEDHFVPESFDFKTP